MSETSISPPAAPIAQPSKPVSEALLNEKASSTSAVFLCYDFNCKNIIANIKASVGPLSLLPANPLISRSLIRCCLLRPPLQAPCMACNCRIRIWGWKSIRRVQQFVSREKQGHCEGIMRIKVVCIYRRKLGRRQDREEWNRRKRNMLYN